MSFTFLNQGNYYLEKLRIPAALLGTFASFLVVLAYLYDLAYFLIVIEFGGSFFYFRIRPIINLGTILLFFVLLLNTSAIKKPEQRLIGLGVWLLFFVLEMVRLNAYSSIWGFLAINVFQTLFGIAYFGITFKAKKGLNVFLSLVLSLRIFYAIFIVVRDMTPLGDFIFFSTYYIWVGVTLTINFWLMIYCLSLIKRSAIVTENLHEWKETQETVQKTIPQTPIIGTSGDSITQTSRSGMNTTTAASISTSTQKVTLREDEMVYPLPRALFWCSSCNTQVKIRLGRDDVYSQHSCPTCGKPVIAWWARGPKAKYYKFMAGLVLMGGGMFSIMIENILNEGLIPVIIMNVLGLIYLVAGLFLLFTSMKIKITSPPADAAPVLPQGIYENFGKQILILTVVGTIGGLVLFGIARLITGIAVL